MQPKNDGDDSDHNVEFTGGNVHLITTKESWEQKIAEAKRDGKIVSIHFILDLFYGMEIFMIELFGPLGWFQPQQIHMLVFSRDSVMQEHADK